MGSKIVVNKIRCKGCSDVIESTYCHDFKFCKCGAVAVDGVRTICTVVGSVKIGKI